jgi:hypothetical protein
MSFFFVDGGWDKVLDGGLRADSSALRIVCPFIKKAAAERLLRRGKPTSIQVITRASLDDFYGGVSDIGALRLLIKNGASIRVVKNLHAKLYLFGKAQAIVTSANLTEAALLRNHEFGLVAQDSKQVGQCRRYFDNFWKVAGEDISPARLDEWEQRVTDHLAGGGRVGTGSNLGDEGVYVENFTEPANLPVPVSDIEQAFVKFFGEGHNRAPFSMTVLEEVEGSGSHWACTYPKGKRPRKVRDGAVMFMGRLVASPRDIVIYGRAIAEAHEPGRDDASNKDFRRRSWKQKWPHYIRVHDPEFVGGTLFNGVSLNELMDALGSDSFASTQRNAARGDGSNTEPRRAFMQQASVELSPEGIAWMNEQIERAFARHGKLRERELRTLDWPDGFKG